jgi:hypothetical protein
MVCLQYQRESCEYTSPYLCHARLTGLAPGTYYFTLQASVTHPDGSREDFPTGPTVLADGTPFSFHVAGRYPANWMVVGDTGVTVNSSVVAEFAATYAREYLHGAVDLLVDTGDMTYANNFDSMWDRYEDQASRQQGHLKGICTTDQRKWDHWFTMWQPLFGSVANVHAPGNHEIEVFSNATGGINGKIFSQISYRDGPRSYGNNTVSPPGMPALKNAVFQSYASRAPPGTLPLSQLGDTWQALYWSQDVGPVHLLVMNAYVPYWDTPGASHQYDFIVADLAAVNRTKTPWVIVVSHAPSYGTNAVLYKTNDCFLPKLEKVFYDAGVDFVFMGHIHTYERSHAVYQYKRNDCGPVWMVLGNGGNLEGVFGGYDCTSVYSCLTTNKPVAPQTRCITGVNYCNDPLPPSCKVPQNITYQPSAAPDGAPGIGPNPLNASEFFCDSAQPTWNAFRAGYWGFGSLTLLSDTEATWKMFANQENAVRGTTLKPMDTVSYTRRRGACGGRRV